MKFLYLLIFFYFLNISLENNNNLFKINQKFGLSHKDLVIELPHQVNSENKLNSNGNGEKLNEKFNLIGHYSIYDLVYLLNNNKMCILQRKWNNGIEMVKICYFITINNEKEYEYEIESTILNKKDSLIHFNNDVIEKFNHLNCQIEDIDYYLVYLLFYFSDIDVMCIDIQNYVRDLIIKLPTPYSYVNKVNRYLKFEDDTGCFMEESIFIFRL